jgi:hypothetical protein
MGQPTTPMSYQSMTPVSDTRFSAPTPTPISSIQAPQHFSDNRHPLTPPDYDSHRPARCGPSRSISSDESNRTMAGPGPGTGHPAGMTMRQIQTIPEDSALPSSAMTSALAQYPLDETKCCLGLVECLPTET